MLAQDSFLILANATRSLIEAGGISEDTFNRAALDLFAFQCENVGVVGSLARSRGIAPHQVSRWSEIPALPISAFKDFEVSTLSPADRSACFRSSGTTRETRSSHFHSVDSLAVYEASLWAGFRDACLPMLPENVRVISLTPAPGSVPTSSLVHMFGVLASRTGSGGGVFLGGVDSDGGWMIDVPQCEAVLRECAADGRPILLLGTAFSFVHFCDGLEGRLKLPEGSLVMETGGYKGRSRELTKEALHGLIGSTLGMPADRIICEYGMCELSSQAYDVADRRDAPDERSFRSPEWARVRIVSPEHGREVAIGETGLVQVFDLANIASCFAIQTEDLGVRTADGFRLLGRAASAEIKGCSLMLKTDS